MLVVDVKDRDQLKNYLSFPRSKGLSKISLNTHEDYVGVWFDINAEPPTQ